MALLKKLKKKKADKNEKQVQEEILKHGLILLGFNFALILIFFFGFVGVSYLGQLIDPTGLAAAFLLLLFIYLFAGASGVVWFRFGQILGPHFKNKKAINSFFVVLISILPLLLLVMVASSLIDLAGGFADPFLAVTFLALLLMSLLAATFEIFVVSLGAIVEKK